MRKWIYKHFKLDHLPPLEFRKFQTSILELEKKFQALLIKTFWDRKIPNSMHGGYSRLEKD